MSDRRPVSDWTTDFDPTDPEFVANPVPILEEMRNKCPVAHTDRMLGVYLSTTYEATKKIAFDAGTFSSRRVIVRDTRPDYMVPALPVTMDPPHHGPFKKMLLPTFTLEATRRLEPRIEATCRALTTGLAGRETCDASADYAAHVASRTLTHLLGVPEQDGQLLLKWIHEIFVLGVTSDAILMRGVKEAESYFAGYVAKRREAPEDDMITMLVEARDEAGAPIPDAAIHSTLRTMMMAGIDTSRCVITSAIYHLAQHPADRERLLRDPDVLPVAIEELLRLYPPVTAGREVMADTVVEGCPMTPGNMVLVSFTAANRDPMVFENADRLAFDRKPNRHLAFGFGPHKCIGMHLGRTQMTIAVRAWLAAFPAFTIAGDVPWAAGQIHGPAKLPVAFG